MYIKYHCNYNLEMLGFSILGKWVKRVPKEVGRLTQGNIYTTQYKTTQSWYLNSEMSFFCTAHNFSDSQFNVPQYMRSCTTHIRTFQPTMDHIYYGGPIRL